MSRRVTLFTLLALAPSALIAQSPRFELTPQVGYMMGWSVSYPLGSVDIKDAISYGGILGIRQGFGNLIELQYTYSSSDVSLKTYTGTGSTDDLGAMATHYIQVGGVRELKEGSVRPFGMGSLGLTIFDPESTTYDSDTRFSFAAGGGIKLYSKSERIGFRLQGRFIFNFLSGGMAMGCGSGGCGGAAAGTALVQFEPSAGLVIAF